MPDSSLLQRLKERKLVQWAVAYLAGGFFVCTALNPTRETWGMQASVIKTVHILLIIGFCPLSVAAQDAVQQERPGATDAVRVLFVGRSAFANRYGDMQVDLTALGTADGIRYETDHSLFRVISRWNLATLATEPFLQETLTDGDFDYVVIHHRNNLWDDDGNEAMYRGAEALHELITRSGGKTVLWMGYEWGETPAPETVASHRSYWETAKRRMDDHPIDGGSYPALMTPTMLLVEDMRAKWGNDQVLPDGLHLNRRALFAASVLLYAYLSGNDPRGNAYAPNDLSPEDIDWAKSKAWEYFTSHYTPARN